jgi:[ribosomal protein S5]-alanine N-acetyltransferase
MNDANPSFQWGDSLPGLEGSRIRLRALGDDDAPAMLSIFGDAEVMRYWSSPPLVSVEGATDLVHDIGRAFVERRLFQWGVCARDADEVLGTCTLFNVDLSHRRGEVGFALRRDVWGQGFATEALAVLIAFAFETMGLHRLEADVDPHNERSQRLLARHGFRREGYLRERWHHLGQIHDAIFLGLLRSEWTPKFGGGV